MIDSNSMSEDERRRWVAAVAPHVMAPQAPEPPGPTACGVDLVAIARQEHARMAGMAAATLGAEGAPLPDRSASAMMAAMAAGRSPSEVLRPATQQELPLAAALVAPGAIQAALAAPGTLGRIEGVVRALAPYLPTLLAALKDVIAAFEQG